MSVSVDIAQFIVLDTPPSLNRAGGQGNWRTWHKHKSRWQRDIETWLMVQQVPAADRARAYVSLRFPTKRRRDTGNFQALIEKSIGDALVNGNWLPDDTPDRYVFEELRFEEELGPKRTTISLVVEVA